MSRSQPLFSVIVPTFERPSRLSVCLRALAEQDYPRGSFEVIVVDDGSKTPPQHAVEPFRSQLDVRLLTQSHSGPAAARNRGAAQAGGDFLAFTDDDCAPRPNWLRALAASFEAFPDCALGGQTINGLPDNPYATASQLVIDYFFAHANANARRARFLASNNLAFPAQAFRAIGGFDGAWRRAAGEDRELCDRWMASGYRMIYVPEAMVEHFPLLTWRSFCRQHFNYGRGALYFRGERARRDGGFMTIEPLSFYLGILRLPFSQAQGARALLLETLTLGSQMAQAAGFLWEAARGSRRD
jgi:glycosyltransferase involved in cell wall biosynthesis